MKKFVFSAVAFVAFAGAAFASTGGNGEKASLSVKPNLDYKTIANFICKDIAFDCYWHVAVFIKKDGTYVKGDSGRKWITNEEDCLELIADITKKLQAEYPATLGFSVVNVQKYD